MQTYVPCTYAWWLRNTTRWIWIYFRRYWLSLWYLMFLCILMIVTLEALLRGGSGTSRDLSNTVALYVIIWPYWISIARRSLRTLGWEAQVGAYIIMVPSLLILDYNMRISLDVITYTWWIWGKAKNQTLNQNCLQKIFDLRKLYDWSDKGHFYCEILV